MRSVNNLVAPGGQLFPKTDVSSEFFEEQVSDILDKMKKTLIEKNKMYGSSSMNLGIIGVYIHLYDKTSRLKSIIERSLSGQEMFFEGIEDTLMDAMGYSILGLVLLRYLKANSDAPSPATSSESLDKMIERIYLDNMDNPEIFSSTVWSTILSVLRKKDPKFLEEVKDILFLREEISK
jgi:hypothetical protein